MEDTATAQQLPTLETERLVLRPLAPEDAATVRVLGDDRHVAEMTLLPHPFTEGDARQWVARSLEWAAKGKRRPFSVLLREGGALVGHAVLLLDWDNERAELYYWLGVAYWGRGYATEAAQELVRHAFEDLALRRVYADHVARNAAGPPSPFPAPGIERQRPCAWRVASSGACPRTVFRAGC